MSTELNIRHTICTYIIYIYIYIYIIIDSCVAYGLYRHVYIYVYITLISYMVYSLFPPRGVQTILPTSMGGAMAGFAPTGFSNIRGLEV